MRLRRALLWLIAPVAAIVFSLLVSSIALALIHKSPFSAFQQMVAYAVYSNGKVQTSQIISILNTATPLFLSGLAVAIGFKMNLFNIGVEGQYYLAALLSASLGAAIHLPAPLHVLVIVLAAMAVGAFWSGIAGLL